MSFELVVIVLATLFTPIKTRLQSAVDGSFKRAPDGAGGSSTAADLDDLERLAQLHVRGVPTDEEFAAKKRQILGV